MKVFFMNLGSSDNGLLFIQQIMLFQIQQICAKLYNVHIVMSKFMEHSLC